MRPHDTSPPADRQPIDLTDDEAIALWAEARRYARVLAWYRRDGWQLSPTVTDALRQLDPSITLDWLRAA